MRKIITTLAMLAAPGAEANENAKYKALLELLQENPETHFALPDETVPGTTEKSPRPSEAVLQGNCLRDPTTDSAVRNGSVAVKPGNQARNEPCSGSGGFVRD